jgi:hypothetical protein
VAFGGIAGLSLGFSLLSGAELFYYLTIGLYRRYRLMQRQEPPPKQKYNIRDEKTLLGDRQHRKDLQNVSSRALQVPSQRSLNVALIRSVESYR